MSCKCHLCGPIVASAWAEPNFNQDISVGHSSPSNIHVTNETIRNSFDYVLRIVNATPANEGAYKCHLQNEFNRYNDAADELDYLVIYVEVLVPPEIEQISISNATQMMADSVMVGSSAYIKCKVKGSPIPIVKWTKDGTPIIYNRRV